MRILCILMLAAPAQATVLPYVRPVKVPPPATMECEYTETGYWWHYDPTDGGYFLHKDSAKSGFVVPTQNGWKWTAGEYLEDGMPAPCPVLYPPGGTLKPAWLPIVAPLQRLAP